MTVSLSASELLSLSSDAARMVLVVNAALARAGLFIADAEVISIANCDGQEVWHWVTATLRLEKFADLAPTELSLLLLYVTFQHSRRKFTTVTVEVM